MESRHWPNNCSKPSGDRWTYIDRDELIEQGICKEAEADQALEQKINTIQHRMVIDTQIPWREKNEGELYFLVLPPLQTLLDRDAQRTLFLNRPERQALRARNYVISTYTTIG